MGREATGEEGSAAMVSERVVIPVSTARLTDREIAVLKLLADGLDTAEVGRRVFLSERTVKNIIHGMTSRLKLRNRTQAVAYALRLGLI